MDINNFHDYFLTLEIIINSKFSNIPSILSDSLTDSGTGYFYPNTFSLPVVSFVDNYGRRGYILQLIINDNIKTNFCIHMRYTNNFNTVVFTGCKDFYNDVIIRDYDFDDFLNNFNKLLNYETIISHNNISIKLLKNVLN